MRVLALLLTLAFTAPSLSSQDGDGAVASSSAPTEFCPVMPEEPVDPTIKTEWEGRSVAFCCKMCLREFLADPELYSANLGPLETETQEVLEDTPQLEDVTTEEAPVEDPDEAPAPETTETGGSEWYAWLGRLHPLFVHFPITLLMLAAVAEMLVRPGNPKWRARARFALALGAPAAAVTAWLGWIAGSDAVYPTMQDVLFRHRWLGVATAALALAALAIAPGERDRERKRERIYRWLVFATFVCVVLAGHHGGMLVFGPDHLRFPG